jgi:polyisoprenoid-binding protein YceI
MRFPAFNGVLGSVLALIVSQSAIGAVDVPSGHYVLEKTHAYITFSYSHLGFSTPHVSFTDFEVDLRLDAENPENSTLAVTIDADSVESRVDEFNEHLVDERFFHTAEFPTITFKSTKVAMGEANSATVTGDLTIKGQTHPVELAVVLNKAGNHPMLKKPALGFNAETRLNRSEWDLGYAVPMVSDAVNLYVSVELLPAP